MKYLKSFNEAVIIPSKMDSGIINSFDSLKSYGDLNGFDVVNYDEFYRSLSEEDRKTAPPRFGTPFFALFHLERKKPMFVLVDENALRFIPNFKEIVDDIIGHERVHAGQVSRRKDGEYILPNPNDQKLYFSNKEEIMAFSWSIANQISKTSGDLNIAVMKFKSGRIGGMMTQLWNNIIRVCDKEVVNRYRKMIYQYLDSMFNKELNESIKESSYKRISSNEFDATFDWLKDNQKSRLYPFSDSESKIIFDLFSSIEGLEISLSTNSSVPNSIIEVSTDVGDPVYTIWKFTDEWFYFEINDVEFSDEEIYKCDQFEGLVNCIKDKI